MERAIEEVIHGHIYATMGFEKMPLRLEYRLSNAPSIGKLLLREVCRLPSTHPVQFPSRILIVLYPLALCTTCPL